MDVGDINRADSSIEYSDEEDAAHSMEVAESANGQIRDRSSIHIIIKRMQPLGWRLVRVLKDKDISSIHPLLRGCSQLHGGFVRVLKDKSGTHPQSIHH